MFKLKKGKHMQKGQIKVNFWEVLTIIIFIMLLLLLHLGKINFMELVECVIQITQIYKKLVK